jgi:hypothetical protein
MPGIGIGVAAVVLVAQAVPASAITQTSTLTASDVAANNKFGSSVALSEDGLTALVGNQFKPSAPSTAYVFTKSGGVWSQTALLSASDGAVNDVFGSAVALSADGNTAVVSATNKPVSGLAAAGTVYVFTRSAGVWTQTAELISNVPQADENFGSSVALSDDGTELAVGSPAYDATGSVDCGAAYFFKYSAGAWTQRAKLTGSGAGALYGWDVAIAGNGATAAVGQPYYKYASGGQTYYYPNTMTYTSTNAGVTWTYQRVISTPAGAKLYGGDAFGRGLSFSNAGTRLVIGAPSESTWNSTTVAGAAFVYTYTSGAWSTPFALTRTATANRNFGYDVSLTTDGASVVVGMPTGNATGAAGGGAAFQYTVSGSTWPLSQTFTSTSSGTGDYFGSALSLDAGVGHPVIGARMTTVNGAASAGAAYTY